MEKRNARNNLFFLSGWNGIRFQTNRRYKCSNLNNMFPSIWEEQENPFDLRLTGFFDDSDYHPDDEKPPSDYVEFYIFPETDAALKLVVECCPSTVAQDGFSHMMLKVEYIAMILAPSILIEQNFMTY